MPPTHGGMPCTRPVKTKSQVHLSHKVHSSAGRMHDLLQTLRMIPLEYGQDRQG